jgi:FKBP-type peptidyl-prolyl cis-trans isomerase 2
MGQVKNGDTVKMHYTGKLKSGKVFDTSKDRQPFEFIVGSVTLVPGLEKGIIGMEIGESKTIEIPPEEAFGNRYEELVVELSKSEFPDYITPKIGQRLQLRRPDGQIITVTVIDLNEDTVTLDGNHPLAGYTLLFDIELVEIG